CRVVDDARGARAAGPPVARRTWADAVAAAGGARAGPWPGRGARVRRPSAGRSRGWVRPPAAPAGPGTCAAAPAPWALEARAAAPVQAHAHGEYPWAGHDCPEVYFLAGKRNPTRTMFDSFDEPAGRTARVLAAIERPDVHVVVFHRRPPFSGAPPSDLVEALV